MLHVPANLSGSINGRFEQGLTGPLTATIGRESAVTPTVLNGCFWLP